MMDALMEDSASEEDVRIFEATYNKQCSVGKPSTKATFEYAWVLSRTQHSQYLKRSILLLEDLFKTTVDESSRRDYLYYIAICHTKLKNYDNALRYTDAILTVEPGNYQAQDLQKYINKKMRRDGLLGMAVVGGAAAVGIGALVGLGIALSKK